MLQEVFTLLKQKKFDKSIGEFNKFVQQIKDNKIKIQFVGKMKEILEVDHKFIEYVYDKDFIPHNHFKIFDDQNYMKIPQDLIIQTFVTTHQDTNMFFDVLCTLNKMLFTEESEDEKRTILMKNIYINMLHVLQQLDDKDLMKINIIKIIDEGQTLEIREANSKEV